jgi:hypothetical protein
MAMHAASGRMHIARAGRLGVARRPARQYPFHPSVRSSKMFSFLLWCLLFVICWPLALLALLLWPLVWLLTLPFRLLGIAVDGVFGLLCAVVMLPARVLGGR